MNRFQSRLAKLCTLLVLLLILAGGFKLLSVSTASANSGQTETESQMDPRRFNHGTTLLPVDGNYYATWSSSFGVEWEHDIYRRQLHLENGSLVFDGAAQRYVGNGSDEAQEPVNAALLPDTTTILSAWEDGSGATVDVHAQLHQPDGTILKSNWIIAGGADSQHSAAVSHLGSAFLVAFADEAPPATGAMVEAVFLDDQTGVELTRLDLSLAANDNWWPVTAGNGDSKAFVGWGDGTDFSGRVVSYESGTGSFTLSATQTYINGIDQYYYQVVWLAHIDRFLVVAKTGSGSTACLIDESGTATLCSAIAAPILRESRPAYKWNSAEALYIITFPTGVNDVAVLNVSAGAISLQTTIDGDVTPALQSVIWPETGIWAQFVADTDGRDLWNGFFKTLFVTNSSIGNDAVYVLLEISAPAPTAISDGQSLQSELSQPSMLWGMATALLLLGVGLLLGKRWGGKLPQK